MVKNAKKFPDDSGRFKELIDYLEKGKAFTQELMNENEKLRMRVFQLEKEKMDLESMADPAKWSQLIEENNKLNEKIELLEGWRDEIEKENKDFANRYLEVQAQNDNLLNLYVSSYQLHSTLDPSEVVKVIEEIILNLIGAEQYFVCMVDERKKYPTIVVGEGPHGPIRGQTLKKIDRTLNKVLQEGVAFFCTDNEKDTIHLACTPLKVKDDVVGAISITKLMAQKKEGLTAIDHELLSLLSDHAATALVSSNLYNRTERKLRTVESFIELLKLDQGSGEVR